MKIWRLYIDLGSKRHTMNRDQVNSAKKSREIGRQLTRDSSTSQKVLIQVLENVGNPDEKGYFEIKVGDKTFMARQLG